MTLCTRDRTLLEVGDYMHSIDVPLGYMSFQGAWWHLGNQSAPWCVSDWGWYGARFSSALWLPRPFGIPRLLPRQASVCDRCVIQWYVLKDDIDLPAGTFWHTITMLQEPPDWHAGWRSRVSKEVGAAFAIVSSIGV
jgi:hypothetical protein